MFKKSFSYRSYQILSLHTFAAKLAKRLMQSEGKMKKSKLVVLSMSLFLLAGCMSAELNGKRPDGTQIQVLFYDGGAALDDLLIIENTNYFGKATEPQYDDPLGDVSFRFNSGERVRAECVEHRKNSLNDDECLLYEVFRSNFELVPEGTTFPRPKIF